MNSYAAGRCGGPMPGTERSSSNLAVSGDIPVSTVAQQFKIARSTIYRSVAARSKAAVMP
jgi:hypothetical protein